VATVNRETTEAHYLHERSGLEPVLRPPVQSPIALRWIPRREELIVATAKGELVSVDPILGTRQIRGGLGTIAVVDVHEDRTRTLVVSREGTWTVGTLRGETLFEGKHGLLGNVDAFFAEKHAVLVGDEAGARVIVVVSLETGQVTGRAKVPARVTAALSPDGKPLLCRSTAAGLYVIPMEKGRSFPRDLDSTGHRLRASGSHVLGFTETGVCVWTQSGGAPQTMRLSDLTAGDLTRDGRYLGLGTQTGAVALARVDDLEKRKRPDLVRAFDQPVLAVAFSERGKWLATAAEALRIWSWED
jgi:hypothetical protein